MNSTSNKTVEQLLIELDAQGVDVVIYSPSFFNGEDWHLSLTKKSPTLKIDISIHHPVLMSALHKAYDAWSDAMQKSVREELGLVMLEHKPPEQIAEELGETLKELHKTAGDYSKKVEYPDTGE